jgi:hypothetical protein
MIRRLALAAAFVTVWAVQGSASAQTTPTMGSAAGGPYANPTTPGTPQPGAGEDRNNWDKITTGQSTAKPGESLTPKAQALLEATALVKSVALPCTVTDANEVAAGPETVNGQKLNTKTFEATCDTGLGYLLVSQDPEKPYGFSCFAADAQRALAVSKGEPPPISCTLPVDLDTKVMATSVLAHLGVTCQANGIRWMGASSKANLEFTEIACADGKGYVLLTAMPGSTSSLADLSCEDALKRGITCKLTNAGPPPITLQTFKDALAQHGVTCDSTDVRVIGQETVQKRHVVEFQCPQYPKGLVAFIPLEGNTAPFQTMDCAKAAKDMHIVCKLTN